MSGRASHQTRRIARDAPMRPAKAQLAAVVGVMILAAPSAGAELKSWVDARGQVHVVDAAAPDEIDAPNADQKPVRFTYRWVNARGQVQITDAPPPKSGRLLSRSVASDAPKRSKRGVERAAVRTDVARRPSSNERADLAGLRQKGTRNVPLPRITGTTAAGTRFDSSTVDDQSLWIAFVTMTCRHCRIEADVMQKIAGDFEPQSFIVVVRGDLIDARRFATETKMDPASVIAMKPQTFPNGPVPFNVIVDDNTMVRQTFTGRLPERTFTKMAQTLLR